jgi:hypothetical protein
MKIEMPTYNFIHRKTKKRMSKFMTISEYEQFKTDNPKWESDVTAPAIISGVSSLKPDKGFREILSTIKKKSKTKLNDFGGSNW